MDQIRAINTGDEYKEISEQEQSESESETIPLSYDQQIKAELLKLHLNSQKRSLDSEKHDGSVAHTMDLL